LKQVIPVQGNVCTIIGFFALISFQVGSRNGGDRHMNWQDQLVWPIRKTAQ